MARAANTSGARPQRPAPRKVRPGLQRVLDAIDAPGWIRNGRADLLASNRLGRALYAPVFDDRARPANTARFTFLNPRGPEFYRDWGATAKDMVAVLRAEAGRNPYARDLTDLVGELSTRSDPFRVMWGSHDVHVFRRSTKRLVHPLVGDLELDQETMALPDESGLSVVVYSARRDTPAQDALTLLAGWSAGTGQDRAADSAGSPPSARP